MKKSKTNKVIMIMAVVALVGFSVNAYAGWGMGYGRHGWGHQEQGRHQRGFGGPGYMSDEQIEKINQERTAFMEATQGLRQDLLSKRLELGSELAKQTPDIEKALRLRKELSQLESRMDQKRVEHMIRMKKINPNAGGRFMGGGGKGPGFSQRGGYCRQ